MDKPIGPISAQGGIAALITQLHAQVLAQRCALPVELGSIEVALTLRHGVIDFRAAIFIQAAMAQLDGPAFARRLGQRQAQGPGFGV